MNISIILQTYKTLRDYLELYISGYGLDGRGSIPERVNKIYLFPTMSRPGTTQSSTQ
jgi:hypothetical protein